VALSDLFSRRRKEHSDSDVGASDAPLHPTKVLARFVTNLSARAQPVLLDLGPVVGANVSFFGEQLGCKIIVEDLSKDIDRHVREGKLEELPASLSKRFSQESASIDGILCWDVFDYLDKASAKKLAEQLTRILKPDGVLLAFFVTAEPQPGAKPQYTRHIVVNQTTLQHRAYAAARGKQRPLPNRDIQRMFENLRITEQFLLKSNLREVLFRKPAETSSPSQPATR
jgi:cyclopropane fatty-acyl-phospholipid synthase-like methyltransferase